MFEFVVLIVLGTSIWVARDAPQHGLSWTWGLGCLALWIVAFPWYLVERGKRRQRAATVGPPSPEEPRAGWYPDPRNPTKYERWREDTVWTGAIRPREPGE